MKAYTSMYPPSVLFAAALRQYPNTDDCELLTGKRIVYRYKEGDPSDKNNYDTVQIDCLALDATLGVDLKLRHFEVTQLDQYKDSLGSRLFKFLETFDVYRDETNSIRCCSRL